MNQQTFVDLVRQHVRDEAVEGTLSLLQQPPGRRPATGLLELSTWYEGLSARDKDRVGGLLALVAHQATFGVLAVLDGSRTFEQAPGPKGHFELRHISSEGAETTLTGEAASPLHELL
jgi:hypothetical protein